MRHPEVALRQVICDVVAALSEEKAPAHVHRLPGPAGQVRETCAARQMQRRGCTDSSVFVYMCVIYRILRRSLKS